MIERVSKLCLFLAGLLLISNCSVVYGSTPTLPPTRVMEVLEYEIGVEIGSRAFIETYGSNMETVETVVAGLIKNMDTRYLHSAGVKHRLGKLIVRTDATTDPLRDSVTKGDSSSLYAFKNYWNSHGSEVGTTHDLAVYHVKYAPSGIAFVNSVGGSSRYALSCGNGQTSWADGTIAHEFGHSWNLRHTGDAPISEYEGVGSLPSRFYESKPRSDGSSAGGEHIFISVMHGGSHNSSRIATEEANTVFETRQNKKSYGDLVVNPEPIKPFGYVDIYTLTSREPITLDVVANDYDCNNDPLNAQLRDTVSYLGAKISLSEGTGPGGRDELIYTPLQNQPDGQDFFHYNVIDTTGRTDWGCVYVQLSDPYITVDLNATSHNYDFGTTTSPVMDGYTRISPNTNGDIYWSDSVGSADRGDGTGGANAINQDIVYSTQPRTLEHKLANGRWGVTINMGDASYARDNMQVKAEGIVQHADVDSDVAEFSYANFDIDVTDGGLTVEFSDNGGSDPYWVLSRMSLTFKSSITTPSAPDGLQAIAVSDSQINLMWNDNSVDEDNFVIERKQGVSGSWQVVTQPAAKVYKYFDSGLSSSKEYFYRVAAKNSFGNSDYTEASATTGQRPVAPLWTMEDVATFNGSSDYQNLPEPDFGNGATEVTIAVRVNPDTKGANEGIITNTYDNSEYFGLLFSGYTDGNPAQLRAMNNYIDGPAYSVPTGQWTHLTGVWKSGQIHKLYVNGVEVKSNNTPPSGTLDVNEWVIGRDRTSTSRYFDGQIKDLKIYVRALSAVEVDGLAGAMPPAAPDGLQASSVSTDMISLSWTDNSDKETNYIVERKAGVDGVWQLQAELPADSTNYSNIDLPSSALYYYRVYASNLVGVSDYSNELEVRTKADILSFAFLADGWLEYDPWQYVYFFDNYNDCSVGLLGGQNGWSDFLSSPTVTDSEIYSGGGNALSATDTDNTYRFAKKAIDASVDVTDNTYYLSTTFKVTQQTNDYDDSVLMALAGIDNSKPKMEFRIRPHDRSIVVTGFGSYYTPVSLYNVEVGKLYRAIVKIVPIVGNTTSVKIYAGVYEIVDGQLMDESDYVWQINGFTFTLTDGQKTYPYILSGVRSEELRSDDLLLSNSWYSIQQLVSGGLGDENWPFTNIDLNQDSMIDSSDLIEMADMWID